VNDPVKIALIVATAPTIAAVGAVILGIVNKGGIKEMHMTMNSRLDQLLASVKDKAFADGVKSEQDRRV
jgi:hypothetical protein